MTWVAQDAVTMFPSYGSRQHRAAVAEWDRAVAAAQVAFNRGASSDALVAAVAARQAHRDAIRQIQKNTVQKLRNLVCAD